MREFVLHLSEYVRRVEKGERIVVTKHNKPSIQLTHYNENVSEPSWKQAFKPLKIKGKPLSRTIIEMRNKS